MKYGFVIPADRRYGGCHTSSKKCFAADDPAVRKAFRLLALKSGGAYFQFNPNASRAIEQLSNQLNAIARLTVGDVEARQQIGETAVPTDRRRR